ncbi:MAG: 50S ribosomal protein L20 [Parachlamydiales bacterium]|nr:50S ribosomal protein L20 [Verrucomicrobiota bacterium]MBS0650213.1 50S ribosomal protein L20 [Verrucomicrobiota bacterium]MBX3719536.1 50S ribosomal protein L20 [Candidatus Acheromyda pituitae]
MVRVTNAVARNRSRKRLMKRAKGFVGDRKNHKRLTLDAVLSALAFNYRHRKQRKRDFRKLWIMRIGVGAKINGMSYSKLVDGLKKAGCTLNRKMLSDMAIRDPNSFSEVVGAAKKALA